ncbi:DUF2190 family protein [Methylocystis iwaonis]|uniref:DUF2190 family protein n=1 Tax=Methylocystis iwaonis TaxID=2885079 RepID=UPI002E7BDCFF|nr:capsid cement protein [Methylocystis iwaonis]
MAKNYVQCGDTIEYAAPYAVSSGDGALIGARFGVAMVTLAQGERGNFSHEGVWKLPKAAGEAWTEGVKIYWDDANKRCTTTAGGNTLIGTATAVAASADETGKVLLEIVA